ncbi:hypothetical protein ABIA24_000930 [Sinorhizobium fredii]|uniref:zinc-binding metallopeptidase family protein n=1 Tax=Rhizobium fredii TaxID=380 RepID=UPI0035140E74
MRLFSCDFCNQVVHFDNRQCISCGHRLGFDPELMAMYALESAGGTQWQLAGKPFETRVFCSNASVDVCNWLVNPGCGNFCVACRHNRLVPNASTPDGVRRWQRIGQAQRHLFYSILRWDIPHPDRTEDPQGGLVFDFIEDQQQPDGTVTVPMTGHDEGVITIRAAEANDVTMELARASMNEHYRTLLGHFRHEIGHYIWNKLVRDAGCSDEFRSLFGDEREDYIIALQRYHLDGPRLGWQENYISPYASSHPWEDFAECVAHLFHIVDTLETARSFGMAVDPLSGGEEMAAEVAFDPYRASSAQQIADAWVPLSIALNAIQRSMGQRDTYPFVVSPSVFPKLDYVNRLVRQFEGNRRAASSR